MCAAVSARKFSGKAWYASFLLLPEEARKAIFAQNLSCESNSLILIGNQGTSSMAGLLEPVRTADQEQDAFTEALKHCKVGLYRFDKSTCFLRWTPGMLELMDYPHDTQPSMELWEQRVHEDDRVSA